jgi:3-keto-disaccharide hydrolase
MRIAFGVCAFVLVGTVAAQEKPAPITFAKADAGKLPAGWTAAKTGTGEGSVWKVTAQETAPGKTGHALTQSAASPAKMFNLCLLEKSAFSDGELSVQVKANEGSTDQGGGLLWRAVDANNYYVCRYNPLEQNYRLYKIVDGVRTQLATKDKLEVPDGKWFTVAVRHTGNKIECLLNGTLHLEVKDDTFAKPGKVGLWTKADAITSFDLLLIAPTKK